MRAAAAVLIAMATLVEAAGGPAVPASAQRWAVRGLDHVVVAVRDLDQAAATYRSLGFALKPGQPHANGIRNQHVKFPDGTEIELLTIDEPGDALAEEYKAHIDQGDGPVFAVLHAPDRPALTEVLRDEGFAVRSGAGLVTFPPGDPLRYLFFGGRNQSPTDRPEHFAHANGATTLSAVWLGVDDPLGELRLLSFAGAFIASGRRAFPGQTHNAAVATLAEGEVRIFPTTARHQSNRPVIGVTVAVTSIDAVRRSLPAGTAISMTSAPDRLWVAPADAHGLWLEFAEAPPGR